MLKVKFWRIGTVVVAKVLEQDESLRAGSHDVKVIGSKYYCDTTYDVRSASCPQITGDTLYLRGIEHSVDNKYACYSFPTEQEAKDYITVMNKIIHDINIESFLKKDFHVADEEVEVTIAE